MSINVLRASYNYSHTFRNDMESFFYVVLYAAIRWLPHNNVKELGKLMSKYFNESRVYDGVTKGGGAKEKNITENDFTAKFEWRNEHMAEWINKVLRLQLRERDHGSYGNIWTSNNLLRIWEKTDKEMLPKDDRVVHRISVDTDCSTANEHSVNEEPQVPDLAEGSAAVASNRSHALIRRKRSATELVEGEHPGPKDVNKRTRLREAEGSKSAGQHAENTTNERAVSKVKERH